MPMEVHLGSRPGKPRLLLFSCATVLVLSLAAAWVQVRDARALGPEVRIADTPIRVQLPRDWIRDPSNPQAFLLPIRGESRRSMFGFERRMQFSYRRWPHREEIGHILESMGLRTTLQAEKTRIGRHPAVQVKTLVPTRIGRKLLQRELLVRVASLPDGQSITVIYEPLLDLRPADAEIMDDVCRTLRLDGDEALPTPAESLARAGVRIPVGHAWQIASLGPQTTPAVAISDSVDGVPTWTVEVQRTWLAHGRTPVDLLADLVAEAWQDFDAPDVEVVQRPDGATIYSMKYPYGDTQAVVVTGAWIVSRSADRTALLRLYADLSDSAAAVAAVDTLAQQIEVEPLPAFADLGNAEEAGLRLARDIRQRGPTARWGRTAVELNYDGRLRGIASGADWQSVWRETKRRYDAEDDSYAGQDVVWLVPEQRRRPRDVPYWAESWRSAVSGTAYEYQRDFTLGDSLVSVQETWMPGATEVKRTLSINGRREKRRRFVPGPAFVAPPLEEVVAGWVARGDVAKSAVIEVSSQLGPGTHTVLLSQMPPDGALPRVLIQDDYAPFGRVMTFAEETAEVAYTVSDMAAFWRPGAQPPSAVGR